MRAMAVVRDRRSGESARLAPSLRSAARQAPDVLRVSLVERRRSVAGAAQRGPVAGVAGGHRDMDLMTLAYRKRGGRHRSLEGGFLGGEGALDIAVVENAPGAADFRAVDFDFAGFDNGVS